MSKKIVVTGGSGGAGSYVVQELIEAVFPGLQILPGTGEHESMLSSAKAERLLGWRPRWSWRDVLGKEIS